MKAIQRFAFLFPFLALFVPACTISSSVSSPVETASFSSSSTFNLDALAGSGWNYRNGYISSFHGDMVVYDMHIESLNRSDIPSAVFECPLIPIDNLSATTTFTCQFISDSLSVYFTYGASTEEENQLQAKISGSDTCYELVEKDQAIATFVTFVLAVAQSYQTSSSSAN